MIKKKGFTLIELLVVVSIIALLSSIIMVSVNDARDRAKLSAIKQNFRQIENAMEMYRGDHGYYPLQDVPLSFGRLALNDIITNQLSSYISVDATIDLSDFPSHITITSGPAAPPIMYAYGYNYSCGEPTNPEPRYYSWFKATGVTDEFKQLYNREGRAPFPDWYCAFMATD